MIIKIIMVTIIEIIALFFIKLLLVLGRLKYEVNLSKERSYMQYTKCSQRR